MTIKMCLRKLKMFFCYDSAFSEITPGCVRALKQKPNRLFFSIRVSRFSYFKKVGRLKTYCTTAIADIPHPEVK